VVDEREFVGECGTRESHLECDTLHRRRDTEAGFDAHDHEVE
jgi:hypothetical protein